MFDLAALQLPSGLQPAPAMPQALVGTMPEIAAEPVDTDATPDFGAMLALQSIAPAPAIALPESGKTLPDPATTPARPLAAGQLKGAQVVGEDEAQTERPAETPQPGMLLPDMVLLTAIFAAPDRLPPANAITQDRPANAVPVGLEPQPVKPANAKPASLPQSAIALAKQAHIELVQPAQSPKPSAKTVSADQIEGLPVEESPSPETPRRTQLQRKPTTTETAAPATVATLAMRTQPTEPTRLSERLTAETAEPEATGLLTPDQPTRTEPQAPASPRAQPAPERVDFATLVDTLARAREEASPHTVHASVSHAEFGRVSLRFDRDEDNGLSVAMSSADPGFARAVSAAAETSPTSGESAGQAARQQTTNQGESQRQPSQHQPAQPRPAMNGASRQTSADETPTSRDARDIYA